jgi:hypothetical protein
MQFILKDQRTIITSDFSAGIEIGVAIIILAIILLILIIRKKI